MGDTRIADMAVAGESDDGARWDDIVEDLPLGCYLSRAQKRVLVDALRLAYEAGRARMTLAEAEEEVRRG